MNISPEKFMYLTGIWIVLCSTLLYLYLHKKTKISLKFLYLDNILTLLLAGFLIIIFGRLTRPFQSLLLNLFLGGILVVLFAFTLTMTRFWRTPVRKTDQDPNVITSPADGKVIYVIRLESEELPVLIKGCSFESLREYIKTDRITPPCWLIGINMTPFDVHKNSAPIDGKIVFHHHQAGDFLSLKMPEALRQNERCIWVIENDSGLEIGIVQIASRLVRRIDGYCQVGDRVKKGQWLGMIRFGSQVDVLLPADMKPVIKVGDQVYASRTVLARTS